MELRIPQRSLMPHPFNPQQSEARDSLNTTAGMADDMDEYGEDFEDYDGLPATHPAHPALHACIQLRSREQTSLRPMSQATLRRRSLGCPSC